MIKSYIPDRGDIVLINFNPQKGKEQAGRRPALILSPRAYNEKIGLCLLCPITTKIKNYPFEVLLPESCRTQGVILSDHVKSLDWQKRDTHFLESLNPEAIALVIERIAVLLK